jgi:hypothetical protein
MMIHHEAHSSHRDCIKKIGRGCLGLTCLFNFPLLVLPCRVSAKKCVGAIVGTKLLPSNPTSEEANGRPNRRIRRTPRNAPPPPLLENTMKNAHTLSPDDDIDEEGGMDAADDEPEAPIDAVILLIPSSLS